MEAQTLVSRVGIHIPPDIYQLWLRIPPGLRPPTHYALLGLQTYEGDALKIRAAAAERIKQIRKYSLKFPHESTKLLNEVAAAEVCLTDSDRKTEYDRQLRDGAQATDQALPRSQVPDQGPYGQMPAAVPIGGRPIAPPSPTRADNPHERSILGSDGNRPSLERIWDGLETSEGGSSIAPQKEVDRKDRRRHKLRQTLAAFTVLSVLTIAGLWLWNGDPVSNIRMILGKEFQPRQNLDTQAERAAAAVAHEGTVKAPMVPAQPRIEPAFPDFSPNHTSPSQKPRTGTADAVRGAREKPFTGKEWHGEFFSWNIGSPQKANPYKIGYRLLVKGHDGDLITGEAWWGTRDGASFEGNIKPDGSFRIFFKKRIAGGTMAVQGGSLEGVFQPDGTVAGKYLRRSAGREGIVTIKLKQ